MKLDLYEGFALPFAVALIAIFTILFGSILVTTDFYNRQKIISIKKIELDEAALIILNTLYSFSNKEYKCSNLQGAVDGSSEVDQIPSVCPATKFSLVHTYRVPSDSSDFHLFFGCTDPNELKEVYLYSCAISNDQKISASRFVKFLINN